MNSTAVLSNLDEDFANAPDVGFRARAISEYTRVKLWAGNQINFDEAKILDFGCGAGIAAVSTALRHPNAEVYGVDVTPVDQERLKALFTKQIGREIPPNIHFSTIENGNFLNDKTFNLIYSWSVFEHIKVDEIQGVFQKLKQHLAKAGIIFIQVNPLYFSPKGSHLAGYFPDPWHHLLVSVDELKCKVLGSGRGGTEIREWQQFIELNRLTARDIIDRGLAAHLRLVREQLMKIKTVPSDELLRIYQRDALVTEEFMALFDSP